MSDGYLTPLGYGEAALTEKRSRFTGRVWPVKSEEEAQAHLRDIRSQYWDATHHVYAYQLRENALMRYSDDGEPQGTSGLPTLEVLRSGPVLDALIIVTRYFGGILLGTGGLRRAYSQTARLALEAAGVGRVRLWARLLAVCPYALHDRVRRELDSAGAVVESADYGADITLELRLVKEDVPALNQRLRELSAGSVEAVPVGEEYRA